MPYRRGDVIAVPYDYSDLTGGKVRPALVISGNSYNLARPDVVAAGISTQVAKAGPYDHVLSDWAAAGLRYPSLVRGRLLTIEQGLIRRNVGHLSARDLLSVDEKLVSFLFSENAIAEYLLKRIDMTTLPGQLVQTIAEKSLRASVILASWGGSAMDLDRLRKILRPSDQP